MDRHAAVCRLRRRNFRGAGRGDVLRRERYLFGPFAGIFPHSLQYLLHRQLQRRRFVCTRPARYRAGNHEGDRAQRGKGTCAGRGSYTRSRYQNTGNQRSFQPMARQSACGSQGRVGKNL